MKKLIIILCLILISCNFNNEKDLKSKTSNLIKITGTIENLKDSLPIVISKMDSRNFYAKKIDSTSSLNGSFEMEIDIKETSEYMIMILDYKNKTAKRNNMWLDNNDVSIVGTYDNFGKAEIHGSKLTEISRKYSDIGLKYNNMMKNGEIDYNQYKKERSFDEITFLFQNPNNSVSLELIQSFTRRISKDSLELFYSYLNPELQNSTNGKAINNFIKYKKIRVGDYFIDFEAKELDENIIKLSDFKGKVIVLDFWAYWCAPCRQQNKYEFPHLKDKYKNEDFVIVSYSVDVNKELWEKSSIEDNINWINVSNLKGKQDKLVTQYGVLGYPTSFIIDKDGRIIKQIKGFNNGVLETELDKIFEIE